MCGDATARKGDQRTGIGVVVGHMWSSPRSVDDPRSHRLAAVEDFDVNPFWRNAESRERCLHIRHEAIRSAKVNVRLSWNSDFFENRLRQMTGKVEIITWFLARARPAVTDVLAAIR